MEQGLNHGRPSAGEFTSFGKCCWSVIGRYLELCAAERMYGIVFDMDDPSAQIFAIGSLYSVAEIQDSLGVGNAGGVRVSLETLETVRRAVILTSDPTARQAKENPYHDRIEGDVLVLRQPCFGG